MGNTYYLFGGKRKKKHFGGKKEKKRKIRAFAHPSLELSIFSLSNTVYQRIELTQHIGTRSIYVSRALCIIVQKCIAESGQ